MKMKAKTTKEIIIMPVGGMKALKARLAELNVKVSEPTILRALRDLEPKKENVELFKQIRKLAKEIGGAVRFEETIYK